MAAPVLSPSARAQVVNQPWGELTWFASRAIGNSDRVTVGRCVLKPGQGNPRHSHPNCAEVLVVLSGRIVHTGPDGADVAMGPGDTITLPEKVPHRALNVGDDDAVLMLTFTSADREVLGE